MAVEVSTRRGFPRATLCHQLAAMPPVVGIDLVYDDMGQVGLLAEHALQRVGDLAHQLALLRLRCAIAGNADMDERHDWSPVGIMGPREAAPSGSPTTGGHAA